MSRIIWLAPYPHTFDICFLAVLELCFNMDVCTATSLSYPLVLLGLVRRPGGMWICLAAQSRAVLSSDRGFLSDMGQQ